MEPTSIGAQNESKAELAVIVVGDLDRPGSRDLVQQLEAHFPTLMQPAVWIDGGNPTFDEQVDVAAFRARHLRNPLAGEIGCALAHRKAYEMALRASNDWCAVFEDDAQLTDLTTLIVELHRLCQTLSKSVPTVVNLNYLAAKKPWWVRSQFTGGLWRPWAPTYTTTAYLVNKPAASKLRESQMPVRSPADWPLHQSELLFLQVTKQMVRPSTVAASVLDPESRRSGFPFKMRVQIWSGLWYFRNIEYFENLKQYWMTVLFPRLLRHLYRAQ